MSDISRFLDACAEAHQKQLGSKPATPKPEKPYGYEVRVDCHNNTSVYKHLTGSAATVRRKGMMTKLAKSVVLLEPVSREQWFRAYGDPKQRL